MTNPMRSLWKVYVVDPRGAGKVLMDGKSVVATDEAQATLKAGVGSVAETQGLDVEQLDVYCEKIAEFIRPRKENQKVVIAKESDVD